MSSGSHEDPPLIPEQRREMLMRLVNREKVLSVAQLTELLHVSHMTVRRDIQALEGDGRVMSIPGGVKVATRVPAEPSRADKSLMEAPHKRAIAREAARLLRGDMIVYLDAGTTTLGMAAYLDGLSGVTVVTNDFAIVDELAIFPDIAIVHVGGSVDVANRSTVGMIAANALRGLNVDLAVLSASSWSAHHGITTPAPGKVEVKRAALAAASQSVLVADSSKYGSFSMYRAVELHELSMVVTDDALPPRAVDSVRELGVELVLASDADGAQSPAEQGA